MSELIAAIEAAWDARDGVTHDSIDVRAHVDRALAMIE